MHVLCGSMQKPNDCQLCRFKNGCPVSLNNVQLQSTHCHPLLWGGGILVDHWSTISSFTRLGAAWTKHIELTSQKYPWEKTTAGWIVILLIYVYIYIYKTWGISYNKFDSMESLGVYYWYVKMSQCGCVEFHVAPLAGCPGPLLFVKVLLGALAFVRIACYISVSKFQQCNDWSLRMDR